MPDCCTVSRIVGECWRDMEKWYVDTLGRRHFFYGVVSCPDDIYYGMRRENGECVLLSCVGSLEGHGFSPEASEDA